MDQGRKRGEDGNTNIWISWERKVLLQWNKKHHLKGYHFVKNKNLLKDSGHKL